MHLHVLGPITNRPRPRLLIEEQSARAGLGLGPTAEVALEEALWIEAILEVARDLGADLLGSRHLPGRRRAG